MIQFDAKSPANVCYLGPTPQQTPQQEINEILAKKILKDLTKKPE